MTRLEFLFNQYLGNQLSEDEYLEFWQLLNEEGRLNQLSPRLQELWLSKPEYTLPDDEWDSKLNLIMNGSLPVKKKMPVWRYVVAASLLFVLAGYAYLHYHKAEEPLLVKAEIKKAEASPGHSGAVLTLSNGKKIILDEVGNGKLAQDADVNIIKKDGEIAYKGSTSEMLYNSISTDKGRQWQLKLPDGTRVWLNSVSSITYPIAFNSKERMVEITGEAYFEVVHNADRPFRIKVNNRIIEDVGTSFNINAYGDEPVMKTTVLEGVVKVYGTGISATSVMLRKSQEISIKPSGETRIQDNVDADEAISWKNGLFNFNHASLESIMRQISRWYDLDVEYKGNMGKETFSGIVSRNSNLSVVLKIMEVANVKFKMEGKKLIVTS